jgi:hypothetical protein
MLLSLCNRLCTICVSAQLMDMDQSAKPVQTIHIGLPLYTSNPMQCLVAALCMSAKVQGPAGIVSTPHHKSPRRNGPAGQDHTSRCLLQTCSQVGDRAQSRETGCGYRGGCRSAGRLTHTCSLQSCERVVNWVGLTACLTACLERHVAVAAACP